MLFSWGSGGLEFWPDMVFDQRICAIQRNCAPLPAIHTEIH
jgi:hypothetical protein